MAELLKAVGLHLDIAGVAVSVNIAGTEAVIDLKFGVRDVTIRGSPGIEIAMATIEPPGRPDQQLSRPAFNALPLGIAHRIMVFIAAVQRTLMKT